VVAVTSPPRAEEQTPLVQWHAAGRAYGGADISGDLEVVAFFPGGALTAVIDGLGHGPEAAAAADAAAVVLRRQPGETVTDLMTLCHEALRRTRGAVISLASFDAASGTVTWLGVGNVAGLLLRLAPLALPAREGLVTRGGVVGYRLPPLRPTSLPVSRGDVLVLATDGIRTDFNHGLMPRRSIENIAASILIDHGRVNDDALVLAVLYSGVSHGGVSHGGTPPSSASHGTPDDDTHLGGTPP
jgi:phosphoserine phosphatase RsbX